MNKALSLLLIGMLVFSLPAAHAGDNKGEASIIATDYLTAMSRKVQYSCRYHNGTREFFDNQLYVTVDLASSAGSLNDDVQGACKDKVNEDFGQGTITDKNDIRLRAGFVS